MSKPLPLFHNVECRRCWRLPRSKSPSKNLWSQINIHWLSYGFSLSPAHTSSFSVVYKNHSLSQRLNLATRKTNFTHESRGFLIIVRITTKNIVNECSRMRGRGKTDLITLRTFFEANQHTDLCGSWNLCESDATRVNRARLWSNQHEFFTKLKWRSATNKVTVFSQENLLGWGIRFSNFFLLCDCRRLRENLENLARSVVFRTFLLVDENFPSVKQETFG